MRLFRRKQRLQSGQPKQAIVVSAFIYDDTGDMPRVFLAKRSNQKRFMPGIYELPGGHVVYGESLEAGLKREIKEELHVDIKVEEPFFAYDYVDEEISEHAVAVVYFAKLHKCEPREITLCEKDHIEALWIGLPAIERVLEKMQETNPKEFRAVERGLKQLERKRAEM